MSITEGPAKRRKRRRQVCPRIPYILNDNTLVYGCEHCMKQHCPKLTHWLLLGKALGLPRDLRELVTEKLKKPYTPWKTWTPITKRICIFVLRTKISLLSKMCCDDTARGYVRCICKDNCYGDLWSFTGETYYDFDRLIDGVRYVVQVGPRPVQPREAPEFDLFLQ